MVLETPKQFNPTMVEGAMVRPRKSKKPDRFGSLLEETWLQHCTVPVLHSMPPLATGLAETATLLAIVKAAMKEMRDL